MSQCDISCKWGPMMGGPQPESVSAFQGPPAAYQSQPRACSFTHRESKTVYPTVVGTRNPRTASVMHIRVSVHMCTPVQVCVTSPLSR